MERPKPDAFVRKPDGSLGVTMTPKQREATMARYRDAMAKIGINTSEDGDPQRQTRGFWKTPDGKELLPRR